MIDYDIRQLKQGQRILDNMTGEELKYISFPIDSGYVLCDDGKNTVFLPSNRIEVIN